MVKNVSKFGPKDRSSTADEKRKGARGHPMITALGHNRCEGTEWSELLEAMQALSLLQEKEPEELLVQHYEGLETELIQEIQAITARSKLQVDRNRKKVSALFACEPV